MCLVCSITMYTCIHIQCALKVFGRFVNFAEVWNLLLQGINIESNMTHTKSCNSTNDKHWVKYDTKSKAVYMPLQGLSTKSNMTHCKQELGQSTWQMPPNKCTV